MWFSGREVGWEQIGELSGDLTGDVRGNSVLTGEQTGDLADIDEGGMAGAAETGDGTDGASAAGEGQRGLFVAEDGDEAPLTAFVSSGRKGSEKKRAPGDFSKQGGDV